MQEGVLRCANAVAGTKKIRLREHERGRQPAGADEFLGAVTIGQDTIDERGALDERGFERPPLFRSEDKRYRVNLPGPLQAAGVTINVVGDALLVDETARGLGAALEFGGAKFVEVAQERAVVGAALTVVAVQLIKGAVDRLVTGQQRGWLVGRIDGLGHGEANYISARHDRKQTGARVCDPQRATL